MLLQDLYYTSVKSKTNITYSIDKLRLKSYITYFDFKELEFFLETYYKRNIKKFWVSDRPMCFHYNYLIEVEEGKTFWFGFMHNNESIEFNKNGKQYNFTVEFNPNKVKDNFILLHILKGFPNWLLRRFDLAMDIPVNIMDLVFDIGNRRKCLTISNGGDNLTYEIGSAGMGHCRIYNKKKEAKVEIVGNLTRVEVTYEYEDFPISDIKWMEIEECYIPEIFLNEYVVSLSDVTQTDATLNALLYAVQHGFPVKKLSRVYRNKIKGLLEGGSRVRFFKNHMQQAFNKCIFSYFVGQSNQIFK